MLQVRDVFQANVSPFVSLRCHILHEFLNLFLYLCEELKKYRNSSLKSVYSNKKQVLKANE